MKYIWILALLSSTTILGYERSGKVSALHADYDGNTLQLGGDVLVDHSLGAMHAEKANLYKEKDGEDFHLIKLQDAVVISLENGAKAFCDRAVFNFVSMTAWLEAANDSKVRYSDTIVNNKGKSHTVLMEGPRIELSMKDDGQGKYLIDRLEAKNLVNLHLDGGEVTLLAETIHYTTTPSADASFITATAGKDLCRMTRGSDTILSTKIEINIANTQATMLDAKGEISSDSASATALITFTSPRVLLDDEKGRIHLIGASEVHEPALGSIHSHKLLTLQRSTADNKQSIEEITTEGLTHLLYNDSSSGIARKLTCHGTMLLNRAKMQATLTSPGYSDGSVTKDQQLCYEDELMQVFASHCCQYFRQDLQAFKPTKLELDGNVRLSSVEGSSLGRCALADSMHYNVEEKKIILSAGSGKKVLFWDEEQALNISANQVHISKDPITGKSTMQGIGNVKLTLSEEENTLIQENFPSLKNKQAKRQG